MADATMIAATATIVTAKTNARMDQGSDEP